MAYLDDVVLFSSSWSEHLDKIRELFVCLAKANLTINLAKCDFGKATVNYLGKVVGQGCVRPIDAKVDAIDKFPTPVTRRELGFIEDLLELCKCSYSFDWFVKSKEPLYLV